MTLLKVEKSQKANYKCYVCKKQIETDTILLKIFSEERQKIRSRCCLTCFKIRKNCEEFNLIDGFEMLSSENKQHVQAHWDQQLANKKHSSKKQKIVIDDTYIQEEIQKIKNLNPYLWIKGYTQQQYDDYMYKVVLFQQKTKKQLQDILRLNDQIISGLKNELVARVADGYVLGKIPRCQQCYGGKLKFDYKNGMYRCPGYRNDEEEWITEDDNQQ